MERNNSINNRGKRSLESEEEQPEQKRPALASVIVEALKVDSLQKLCSSLEPILRRVVSEEVERALAKLGPPRLNGRLVIASPKRIDGSEGRNLQLLFRSHLSLPLFTGGKEDEGWTQEEFDSHTVKEREGKRVLLTGDLQVTLKEGVGTLGELTFTDNSSWIRSRKFRLGLKVASGFCEGLNIREAKTQAFTVKDHRGELWRLEKIGKDGSFHKRLSNQGIFTVEDFLRLVVRDQQKLRNILGSSMSNKMWDALLEHAKTCVPSGKLYIYHPDVNRNVGVIFNNIYEFIGFIAEEKFHSADSLSESQKVYVDALVKKAYENWNEVVEYDGKSPFKQVRRSARNENQMESLDYSNTVDRQLQLPQSVLFSSDQALVVEGYNEDMSTRYSDESQLTSSNIFSQFPDISYTTQDHLINTSNQLTSSGMNNNVGLALGRPQQSGFLATDPSIHSLSNLNTFEEWSGNHDKAEFLIEVEIPTTSHEMLENEDMQHLLHLFSMGPQTSHSVSEDCYGLPPDIPSPQPFGEDRARSGKAVVGWLKIKAAMRWGFFIRKKAAER
ncbi:hypothetical protein SAY87_007381 [Trapa incisa]|uniref:Uncharacterized protein n=1 Tax=Trapa incisa TaxID=236973 RepID=A0AAN7K0W6_9MYRT|nr:hypothetical protein SAY87_007381 [Trapa incisa]